MDMRQRINKSLPQSAPALMSDGTTSSLVKSYRQRVTNLERVRHRCARAAGCHRARRRKGQYVTEATELILLYSKCSH